MAELLPNPCCHTRSVVQRSSLSPATNEKSSVSLFSPLNRHLNLSFNAIDHGTSRVLIQQAQPQLQDPSSTETPSEGIKWWERDLGASLTDIRSTEELMDLIENAQGKLVVLEFFASWCGSCRALYPKLCKLAKEHPDIVFAKVNFDENKAFCKSMDVKVLPYFHLYVGGLQQLDSFSCSLAKLQRLRDAMSRFNPNNRSLDV